ncbi:MAG TPA: argininosuccinate synthase [Candidatus Obscuribacterales bacterium]
MKKILLAYSGGLDTSCVLAWLKDKYDVPVVAYCADVGQNEDFEKVHKKALATGAESCIVEDLKNAFVEHYVFAALQANSKYEGVYLLGTSLARPCIASGMVDAALKSGCDAIAHGCTGKGNDQVRFELAVKALAPHLQIIAPWRSWEFQGRDALFDYAESKGIPLPVTREKPYSIDANVMHISYEGGILEDPWLEPPSQMYQWTADPQLAPEEPEYVTIEFKSGLPVALNGKKLSPLQLLILANEVAAKHGIGRVDLVENRYIGIKSRGVYESPGATILWQAHQSLESITLDKELAHLKEELALKFASLAYNGYWFSPEMQVIKSAIECTQHGISGEVKLKLYKGSCYVVGRRAPLSLYNSQESSFDNMSAFSPADSGGFININALRLSNWSKFHGSIEKGVFAAAGSGSL